MSDAGTSKEEPAGAAALPKWQGSGVQQIVMGLDKASLVVIVSAMAGMSIIVTAQVFWRHVLNSSIDSADELSRLLFVWAMFLAIPHGIRYSVHVGIDLLTSYLPYGIREFVFRLMSASAAALMAAVFIASWIAVDEKWQQLMPTLPVTSSVFYIAILICALHSFIHLVLYTWGGSSIWGGRTL